MLTCIKLFDKVEQGFNAFEQHFDKFEQHLDKLEQAQKNNSDILQLILKGIREYADREGG